LRTYLSTTSAGGRDAIKRFEEYRALEQKRRKQEQQKRKRTTARSIRKIRTNRRQQHAHRPFSQS
jgi:hypothetical protein